MLVCLQFPILDLRGFVGGETGRLDIPHWPIPEVGKEFVRAFGLIRRRPLGGLPEKGEARTCVANRAIRFKSLYYCRCRGRAEELAVRIRCAFRRFYFDGRCVGKFEIGLRVPNVPRVLVWPALGEFLRQLVALPVQVGHDPSSECPLVEAGQELARHYLRSTTVQSQRDLARDWWVQAGSPILVIECPRARGIDPNTMPFKCIDVPGIDWGRMGCSLYQGWITSRQSEICLWMVLPAGSAGQGPVAPQTDGYRSVRLLRISLLRYYAEQQCFYRLVNNIRDKANLLRPAEPPRIDLQDYLNRITRDLRQTKENLVQKYGSDMTGAVMQSWDYAMPGEIAELVESLEQIRPQVFRKVKEQIQEVNIPRNVFNLSPGSTLNMGDLNMPDNRRQVNVTGRGNTVVQATDNAVLSINNSFNQVKSSNASDEVKNKMRDLKQLVDQLVVEKADPDTRQKVADDYEVLAKEVSRPKPRKDWLAVSGKGLIEAAETCSKLVAPIGACVKGLLSLFGIPLP
jgi:hypothetical protein